MNDGITFHRMLVRPLSQELAVLAKLNVNETPDKLEGGLDQLKLWITQQPHLKARTDDQWLAAFLRGCKHSVERAKKKLDLYYSLRSIAPDLFSQKCSDRKYLELLKTESVLVLPATKELGDARVVLVRPKLYNPNQFAIVDFFTLLHIFQQIMYIEDDVFMINGTRGVVDLEGVTMSHIMQLTPTTIRKIIVAVQEASPVRIKSVHFVNITPVFEKIFNIVIKLLNEKLKKRFFVHGREELYPKFVDKTIVPIEYGGSWGSSQGIVDHWIKKFDQFSSWFDEDCKFGTDESMRPGKPYTASNIFGVEGSFRQLSVD